MKTKVIKVSISLLTIFLGFFVAFKSNISIDSVYVKYLSVGFMVSLIGLIKNFFIVNYTEFSIKRSLFDILLLPVLVSYVIYFFDLIGVDLYLPAIIGFGLNLFALLKSYIRKL